MADLENSDDETDETYIPELENESDCDEVSDESYNNKNKNDKNDKNDNDENSNTEKLSDGQNGDKSTDSSTNNNVPEEISKSGIKKKQPDHK